MELDQLKKEKDNCINKVFWLCLEIILIFGIPAFISVYFGRKLDSLYDTGLNITFVLLFISFILSWILVIRKYLKISKKLKEIDLKIKNYNSETK